MSDHYHYGYADERHSHGDYAEARHDHDAEYAERYHRHHDDESTAEGLREDLGHAEERIRELEDTLNAAIGRIARLEERLNSPAREPQPAGAAPEKPQEGWGRIIPPQKKSHYFVKGRSLCGRYGFPPMPLNPDEYTSPDDCAACRKRLTLRQLDQAALGKRQPS